MVILCRHDKEVQGLLIFCISRGCWLRLLKCCFIFSLGAGGITVELAVFYTLVIALVAVGIMVIIVAIILSFIGGTKKGGKVRGAGVIMVGPVPIIFGTDKTLVKTVLALALALTIVVLIIIVVDYWLLR